MGARERDFLSSFPREIASRIAGKVIFFSKSCPTPLKEFWISAQVVLSVAGVHLLGQYLDLVGLLHVLYLLWSSHLKEINEFK